MENASKALIIAGAILLSIAIIGIGMSVFNGAQDAVNQANMDEATITAFNSKFTSFQGKNVKGSNVNNLLSAIRQSNLSNQDDESKVIVVTISDCTKTENNLSGTDNTDNIYGVDVTDPTKLPTGYTYEVKLTPNKSSGLYTQIDIKQNPAS